MCDAACWVIRAISGFFRAMGLRSCRFYPSCSVYATEAFQKTSFIQAAFLSLKRIFRCHPFSAGGYDPLPVQQESETV